MSQTTFRSVRSAFLSGVIVLAPLAVTIAVFNWLIGVIGGPGREIFRRVLPERLFEFAGAEWLITLVAAVIVLLLITVLGFLSRYVIAKFFFAQTERMMQRVPLIGAVYNTSKQIIATFSAQRRAVFEKVVLIQFPRSGTYAIGFLTSRTQGEAQIRTTAELWNVFVPTTPNPTSGFLIMVPRDDIIVLDMTVGDAMKLVISGGGVVPAWPSPEAALDPTAGPAASEADATNRTP